MIDDDINIIVHNINSYNTYYNNTEYTNINHNKYNHCINRLADALVLLQRARPSISLDETYRCL